MHLAAPDHREPAATALGHVVARDVVLGFWCGDRHERLPVSSHPVGLGFPRVPTPW
ncbi:MAG: hypothetical protein U5R31_01105 [Acidimicrobiia bacterium]|nr:hypothetical protein [Acidimicrobiia bacterium]